MQLIDDFRKKMRALGACRDSALLVAVSGGVDSMALLHLAVQSGYRVEAAHANFKLRGADSDADQKLVEEVCRHYGILCHTKTLPIDKAHENVQLRARELRYSWFRQLTTSRKLDFLLTAHHLDDRIETFFMHLLRGSGVKGLKSIPSKTGNILRPLIAFEKSELLAYAGKEGLKWREDSSNASDDYLRNTIRHGIAQDFASLAPSAKSNLSRSIDFLAEADRKFEAEADAFIHKLPVIRGLIQLKDSAWRHMFSNPPLHKYILETWGFTAGQLQEVEQLETSQPGRFVESSTHRIYRDRNSFIIEPLADYGDAVIRITSDSGSLDAPLPLVWQPITSVTDQPKGAHIALLNKSALQFPLVLRKWQPGDRFRPSGMRGSKKLSDYLIDLKLSLPEKNRVYVLVSGDEICWVAGYRVDERYAAKPGNTNILRIELLKKPKGNV